MRQITPKLFSMQLIRWRAFSQLSREAKVKLLECLKTIIDTQIKMKIYRLHQINQFALLYPRKCKIQTTHLNGKSTYNIFKISQSTSKGAQIIFKWNPLMKSRLGIPSLISNGEFLFFLLIQFDHRVHARKIQTGFMKEHQADYVYKILIMIRVFMIFGFKSKQLRVLNHWTPFGLNL